LGRVQVDITGVPNETVQLLYSSVSANFVWTIQCLITWQLYRTHIVPADC
jgi:hypothetical protein